MSAQNVINTAIYSTLNAATALTTHLAGTTSIYWLQAPDNATLPYVVFSQQSGGPENITPSDSRILDYYITGYSGTAALSGTIDAQISTALHGVTLSVSGYTNFWTVRTADITLVENLPNGERVYSSGGIYQLRIDS